MKKIITDLDLNNKKVLMRVDFNVPMKEGKITDENRIIQALPTIKYALEQNAKLILFNKHGSVISGINSETFDWEANIPKIENLAKGLPKQFDDFIYNEPIKTRKSTFCIWRTIADSEWQTGDTVDPDGSEDILYLLDGDPEKYVEFCEDYYEKDIPLDIVERIYQGEPISLEMIYKLNDELEDEDIEIIKNELEEIKYPNTL